MTVKEAARYFKVSASTIYRRIKKGVLRAIKVGRRWKVYKQVRKRVEWPSYVHESARADGLGPNDFEFKQWPVSKVKLSVEDTQKWGQILRFQCRISKDVPQANGYVDTPNGPKWLPDPVGMCLSRVRLELLDGFTGEVFGRINSGPDDTGLVDCWMTSHRKLSKLWKRLRPGGNFMLELRAFPLFMYLDKEGAVRADYATGSNGYFKGKEVYSDSYVLRMDQDGHLSIK